MQPPGFAVVASFDGVPEFLFLCGDEGDAANVATDAGMRDRFRVIVGDDHHIRVTVHAVADIPEEGLPPFFSPLREGFQTWELNPSAKPEYVAKVRRVDSRTRSAKRTTRTATTKKATAKRPVGA